ncbi:MAG: hypothetical protein AAFV95_08230 [Bacteroidota bacterium]
MKALTLFVAGILMVTAQTCKKKSIDTSQLPALGDTLIVVLNEPLMLKNGSTILFEKLEESRCPKGISCIRAGEAIASMQVGQGDKKESMTLESKGMCEQDNGKCGQSKSTGGLQYHLLNIYPYPGSGSSEKTYAKMIVKNAPSS